MTSGQSTTKPGHGGQAQHPSAQERSGLAALLAELGPDAATLCEGWDTSRLAAHLVTRESHIMALSGILVPALHGVTARLEEETRRAQSYQQLVHHIAGGPPLGRTFVGIPGLVGPLNLHEFFVHHEDVRRAQPGWEARTLSEPMQAGLWRRLVALAPVFFRGLRGVKLHLVAPDGRRRTVGHGDDEVTVTGPVPELFLYLFGRRSVAEVSVTGSIAGQARLAAVDLSQ
jgi:uncharacterized protein (TIGR03085 family)